tara:strand:+ start:8635 stop:12099 length:3465 start_codon:yes stop_codon:yes gene_type:complete
MIEQGLFQNHFVGRDGFQWWIGQVAPAKDWEMNLPDTNVGGTGNEKYKGYGERYKVRIMGYHTAEKDELPDEDLPWATLMYPVTSGGGGSFSQTSNIVQGTFVYGFFLDGEEGQQPVIMGCIGHNDYQEVMKNVPSSGFIPFRGLPPNVPVSAGAAPLTQGKSSTVNSKEAGSKINGKEKTGIEDVIISQLDEDQAKENNAVLAQPKTCEPLPVSKIQQSIRNLIRDVETAKKGLYDFEKGALQDLADKEEWINKKLEMYAEQIAGGLKVIYAEIEKYVENKTNQALKFAYDLAFPNERSLVEKTSSTILDTIACFFRKIMGQLVQLMVKFLGDAVDRIINVSKCFVDNFIGGIFGALGGIIEGMFAGLSSMISSAVDIGEGALDLGGDVLGMIDQLISFLSCDDRPECSEINDWNIISGGNQISKGDLTSITDRAKDLFQETQNLGLQALDNFDMVTDINLDQLFNLGDDCNTREILCGAPILEFFGSNGTGAAGNLVIGAAGDVIGVDMVSFGVGYNESVRAEVIDGCGKGNGTVLRPVFGRIPTDGTPIGGTGGGTPALAPPNIGLGPFSPQNYPFPANGPTSLSPVPLGPVGGSSPIYGVGPTGFGNEQPPECLDTEFTVTRSAVLSNTFTFRLVDADPSFITGWDYTGDDVSGGENDGGTSYIECVVPGKDYLVQGFLPDGTPCPNPLRIDAGGSTVRLDDAFKANETVDATGEQEIPPGGIFLRNGNSLVYLVGGNDVVEIDFSWEWDDRSDIAGYTRSITIATDGAPIVLTRSSGDTTGLQFVTGTFRAGNRYPVTFSGDSDSFGFVIEDSGPLPTQVQQRIRYDDDFGNGFDENGVLNALNARQLSEPVPVTAQETETKWVSDGDYLDLVVTAGAGKFRNVKNNTCLYRLDPVAPSDGPGVAVPIPSIGTPTLPNILVPAPVPTGDIGIVDVIVVQSGGGFISGPDGSKGGDGRTWSEPGDTIVVKSDGRIETPIPAGNYFCVEAGDTVELPPGTFVVTETNDEQGGGERINGGSPYTVSKPGCFTTPYLVEDDGAFADDAVAYSILLYLCDIIVESPGFGYEPNDPVIITPDRGAEATLRVDKFGRVIGVNVIKSGEGFKELPSITIDSDNGYNAVLLPKHCIDREIEFEDPEKVVQVIDCVGNF